MMLLVAQFVFFVFSEVVLTMQPRFNVVMKNVTVIYGQTAVLPCSINHLQGYKVVWMNPHEKPLTLDDRRIITDERISLERPLEKEWNLHIRKVKLSDAGTYLCQVNTSPILMRKVRLYVHKPAEIIEHLSSRKELTVREGDTVELVCNVTGIPPPTVEWYRLPMGMVLGERRTGEEKIGTEGEVLVIRNVSRYCDDVYKCVAYNGVEPVATREMRVNVEFPPEVRLPNKRLGQMIGKSTILECEVSAFPHSSTAWTFRGEDILRNKRYSTEVYNEGEDRITLNLKIQLLTEDDFGEYTCASENHLGVDSETMILHEYPRRRKKTTTTTTTVLPVNRVPYPHSSVQSSQQMETDDNDYNENEPDEHERDRIIYQYPDHPSNGNGRQDDNQGKNPYGKPKYNAQDNTAGVISGQQRKSHNSAELSRPLTTLLVILGCISLTICNVS